METSQSFSFLSSLARTYLNNERENMIDYCFVFPNKRSATFFAHALRAELQNPNQPFIMPATATITDFTASLSPLVEASRLDQLFLLYKIYSSMLPKGKELDFDRFNFWGDILLYDFNDVDRYLVDPEKLFTNVRRLKEINATFLTEEQVEIIRRYWGEERVSTEQAQHFWEHIDESSPLQQGFIEMWRLLLPMFNEFKKCLAENGMANAGMLLRNAVELLKGDDLELPFKRYIFVGFNVLTLAEARIFEMLQQRQMADFYWDMNSPAMRLEGNRAARFLNLDIKCFKSLYDIQEKEITYFPEIEVEGIPSQVGMAKRAGQILGDWVADGTIPDASNAMTTAVILPDENLFIPLIHSLPSQLGHVNVTMGFPLRLTPVAAFLDNLFKLHANSKMQSEGFVCINEQLRQVLSDPLLLKSYPEECEAMLTHITENRLFTVPFALLRELAPSLVFLFQNVSAGHVNEQYEFVSSVIDNLLLMAGDRGLQPNSYEEGSIVDDEGFIATADILFMRGMDTALRSLKTACDKWHIEMNQKTFFSLISSSLNAETVNFSGEPLCGLQIMGMLETRALDFENIIVLSMNERVFPKNVYQRSFIPDSVRRGYGMATIDFQESIFAYYFYRLISRAKNVKILYDNRTKELQSGEPSRYITQLQYLYPSAESKIRQLSYAPPRIPERGLEIAKTPEVIDLLNRYRAGSANPRPLSASSIKDYLKCPLFFYLKDVCGLAREDDITDYMDASTYGTIVHAVCQALYEKVRGSHDEVTVTEQMLDNWIRHPEAWQQIIIDTINKTYLHREDGDLTGETLVIMKIIQHLVTKMLKEEKQFAPFQFIEGEKEIKGTMNITAGLDINVRMFIDRIDRVNQVKRIIDYKTGGDKVKVTKLENLFDSNLAVMQLMFYCNGYQQDTKHDEAIQPMIYQLQQVAVNGLTPITIGGKELTDYRAINKEFKAMLAEKITEIFNPEIPFSQCEDQDNCIYCPFKEICGRQ